MEIKLYGLKKSLVDSLEKDVNKSDSAKMSFTTVQLITVVHKADY